jgi:inner membrane protein involved in colicin E2 resistance
MERVLLLSLLISFYLYLFLVLRLEEFALLAGATGIFVVIVMVLTKKINWLKGK